MEIKLGFGCYTNSLGFPIGEKKRFGKQRHGYGSSVDLRASADLPRSFCERRVPGYASRITCKNGPKAKEDMLLKTF